MLHPKVVLVGPRASGKSTLVASVSGVLLGTSTTCPVEWNIRQSDTRTWSAKVSVGYFSSKIFNYQKLRVRGSLSLNDEEGPCHSPAQLLRLLRKAEIAGFSPGQNIQAILSMDEITVTRKYSNMLLSSLPSRGVIYVEMLVPSFSPREITIVDLPGLRETGYSDIIRHTKNVARFYAAQEGVLLAVVIRITDRKSKPPALSTIGEGKWNKGTTVILTHGQEALAETRWLEILAGETEKPYIPLCFHLPDLRCAFAFTEPDIRRLRQDEAAYFLFSEPWSSLPHQTAAQLGVLNILRQWELTWNLEKSKYRERPERTIIWKGVFVGLVIALLLYVCQ
ncbi:hypothetical protein GALMADRAFT_220987 [Galerina marginata CBS 339.88]|uniref:Uncharacterized protein n=1 Tax=Galerina marginata (strain CBS 339.88) TaxID=685588 RepID=A0A067TIQ5_GALM3|nr:hypothetical protein GALMADRAFT_220987 [Galerina marginata CBS 339.88]